MKWFARLYFLLSSGAQGPSLTFVRREQVMARLDLRLHQRSVTLTVNYYIWKLTLCI